MFENHIHSINTKCLIEQQAPIFRNGQMKLSEPIRIAK